MSFMSPFPHLKVPVVVLTEQLQEAQDGLHDGHLGGQLLVISLALVAHTVIIGRRPGVTCPGMTFLLILLAGADHQMLRLTWGIEIMLGGIYNNLSIIYIKSEKTEKNLSVMLEVALVVNSLL